MSRLPGLAIGLVLAAAGGAASAQGMFPSKPDVFAPQLVAKENAPLAAMTPVTDAMLLNPPDSDWLMWRRTYNGWGYSPLDQINKDNVKNLQVAWSWSLTNGATETTPKDFIANSIEWLPAASKQYISVYTFYFYISLIKPVSEGTLYETWHWRKKR